MVAIVTCVALCVLAIASIVQTALLWRTPKESMSIDCHTLCMGHCKGHGLVQVNPQPEHKFMPCGSDK